MDSPCGRETLLIFVYISADAARNTEDVLKPHCQYMRMSGMNWVGYLQYLLCVCYLPKHLLMILMSGPTWSAGTTSLLKIFTTQYYLRAFSGLWELTLNCKNICTAILPRLGKQFLDQGFNMFVDDCRLFMCFAPLLHCLSILEEETKGEGGDNTLLVNLLISPRID